MNFPRALTALIYTTNTPGCGWKKPCLSCLCVLWMHDLKMSKSQWVMVTSPALWVMFSGL